MLTPPWHLIPPLIYSEVRVRPFSDLYFLQDLWDWLLIVIFVISLLLTEWGLVRIQVRISSLHPLVSRYGTVLRMRPEKPNPSSCDTIKILSCSKGD
jgi:hypothetical protein